MVFPIDYFAYIKLHFLVAAAYYHDSSAIGLFFTYLTDSPIAICCSFLWWIIDKGATGLSGDTKSTHSDDTA